MHRPSLYLGLLAVAVIGSCQQAPDLTEQEIFQVLNQIIADRDLPIYGVCQTLSPLQLTGECAREFNAEDQYFIATQIERFKTLKIKPNSLYWRPRNGDTIIPIDVSPTCDSELIYRLSLPLISADRTKVLIEIVEDCNCMLGGQGGKHLYVKEQGHWVKRKTFDSWISCLMSDSPPPI